MGRTAGGDKKEVADAGRLAVTDQIEVCDVDLIVPYEKNARVHSKKQIRELAASIRQSGHMPAIVVDEANVILAGHGRLLAAKELGLKVMPVVRYTNLSEMQKRRYRLADNKIAENARWDEGILVEELKLLTDDANVVLDVESIGFSAVEVDRLIESVDGKDDTTPDDDALVAPDEAPKRCKLGDLWQLGPHRLICGDARNAATIDRLMGGEIARMAFLDPPYNVPVSSISGRGRVQHDEFIMASGEMPSADYVSFLSSALQVVATHVVDGAIVFCCMDWRHMREVQEAGAPLFELRNLIIWAKDNAGLGTFYRSQHELIFAFKRGNAPHLNNFELGQHGRHRSNLWSYRGLNSNSSERVELLGMHPTIKPTRLVADAIRDVSGRGDIVLDTFAGAGTTAIAAHKTGRRAFLCEIDERFCNQILRRWETYSHDEAELLSRG